MFTTRPEIRGTFGVVASTHWLASGAAMAVLERGGNAFDAAAAAGFVLQVVEPHLNGPLGEVPILSWNAERGIAQSICGQGTAPAAATIEAFRNDGYDIIPGSGLVAATVPGSFDAWMSLLLEHGTWRLRDVLEFAIGYAQNGHPLVPRIADTIGTMRELFETHWPTSAAVYLPHGVAPKAGKLFRNPALAGFYRRLIEEAEAVGSNRDAQIERARRIWSQGFVAEAIDRFSRKSRLMDGAGKCRGGFITGEDMARWRARVEKPLCLDHHGWTVLKCGPWSQGPVMLQTLAMLDGDDLGSLDPNGPEFIHLVVEALKLSLADREAWYADPDFFDVPIAALLSRDYAAERRALIGESASFEQRPGSPAGRAPLLPARPDLARASVAGLAGTGEPTMAKAMSGDRAELETASDGTTRGDTCHVDVIDRWGNMVAATPSGGWFQSSPVIPELGVCLGVRGQMFWLDPTVPCALAPGKRPRTTLTPSMALKDGVPALAFGTPGGDQQDQWSTLFFLRHVHHGLNLQEAIDAPSCHTDHATSSFWPRHAKPGTLTVERRFPTATIEALERKGHQVEVGDDWSEGRLCACAVEPDGDQRILKAGANPRGMQGYAVGR
ncbi:MAG TPA: gamma-glutamyltransferase family protein [Aliidongia sp.]|uniref:gamma-glutamyltransferase family protein n=1 Tax=Aliidongia sp. TaxID=1914230 RepID=UPI002DDCF02B|nr:gamma-glutamyltransferase family protein [Aliidongia sp.]HEV2676526.1 gamma-glutamyltransferase family protein [Aliidongia sp.]